MFTHKQLWAAIDALAKRYDYSPSGLARAAGLDPTSFNKSKRFTRDGKERWPSTESINKILKQCGASLDEFSALVKQDQKGARRQFLQRSIPLIGMAQAGQDGFFDDGGFPVGGAWDHVHFPSIGDDHAYVLEVKGDSMEPLYRVGDRLIVSPTAETRRGDRVVVKTLEGEVMAKILERKTDKKIILSSINKDHQTISYSLSDIEWVARIIWASQ